MRGLALANAADYQRLAQDLTALTGERQLVRITAAATLTATTKGDPISPLVTRLVEALATVAGAQDPLVKAAVLRALPVTVPEDWKSQWGGWPRILIRWFVFSRRATRRRSHFMAPPRWQARRRPPKPTARQPLPRSRNCPYLRKIPLFPSICRPRSPFCEPPPQNRNNE